MAIPFPLHLLLLSFFVTRVSVMRASMNRVFLQSFLSGTQPGKFIPDAAQPIMATLISFIYDAASLQRQAQWFKGLVHSRFTSNNINMHEKMCAKRLTRARSSSIQRSCTRATSDDNARAARQCRKLHPGIGASNQAGCEYVSLIMENGRGRIGKRALRRICGA